ncbi:hypothetical protein HIM_11218 [Hirsutella minnesotensis 3608]|uniref:Transcription activator GCR1-like domain-containing protein n=1 Tax=Hirsutella minnesotensis 3608 TaxID=1043627 RepID=A0A0F7ZWQ9_9HYPO|nr:hypothetical protein HIM_11218 [Hirsutella minnesotensis 3608]
MAAGAFLELMEWLREVLLQDAVFLRESYPDHPLFQDPVFSCPEFAAFASKVRGTCTRAHEDSHSTAIQKAMPVVAEKLRTVLTQQAAAEQLAERRHANLLAVARDLCAKLEEFAQTTCTVTFSPGRGAAAQQTEVVSAHQGRGRAAGEAIASTMRPPRAASPQDAPTPSEKQRQEHVREDQEKALDKAHSVGWGEMPSVDALERDWGARWRPPAEKNYFPTRKTIVEEVRRRVQLDGLAEDIVARQMDGERGSSSSLDRLFKAIRRGKRGEGGMRARATI